MTALLVAGVYGGLVGAADYDAADVGFQAIPDCPEYLF